MTDTNPAKFKKLVTLLKELFQLDQPDLDFGIYRIMHAKAGEVTQFLERDLLPQVKDAFAQYQSADSAELKKKLEQMTAQLTEAGVDPETAPKVRELREQIKGAIDLGALENEVYDHLYSFFRRYYSEGDFLAKRVYKPGVYAIPYEGEEVTLHWANKDQHYIKTSEYLRDYAFRLNPEAAAGEDPMRVHFKLVDAAEGEHGNVKAVEGKDRVFVLASEDFIGVENGELELRFEYRPATLEDWPADQREGKKKPPAQKELTAFAVERVLAVGQPFKDWIPALAKSHIKADGELADYTRLEAHLRRYTARNTFDYFIHKDLGGFLRRELDFYIKNEVMRLDDVESETAAKVEQYLSKIKVIRRIAGKIIEFLAQLENFQKKLWLKKKFVVDSGWLVAISQVPDELLPDICANTAQLEEWNALHSLQELPADVTRPAYSVPLTPEYLRAHPSLMVDTQHFDEMFEARLRESFGDIDGKIDGVLMHSENFQALSLMQMRYREKVQCIYIDPPYNTGGDGFPYKDNYQHSSWLAMIEHRLCLSRDLLDKSGIFLSSCDDHEYSFLRTLVGTTYGVDNLLPPFIWKNKAGGGDDSTHIAAEHEYVVAAAKSAAQLSLARMTHESPAMTAKYNKSENGRRYYLERLDKTSLTYSASMDFEIQTPDGTFIKPPQKDPSNPTAIWRWGQSTVLERKNELIFQRDKSGEWRIYTKTWEPDERGVTPRSLLVDAAHGRNREGTVELGNLFGSRVFRNPKPTALLAHLFRMTSCAEQPTFVDYFAGSGTTANAIINLNREDGCNRRFVLAEFGDHFNTVLVPRVKKVAFSSEWVDGKPVRPATPEEAERSPRLIKVIRLESYEDSIGNLALSRSSHQQNALFGDARTSNTLREQYLLCYQLDVESRNSASLLNIAAFADPTAYKLKVKTPSSDESREVNVDLLETFNWLLGLTLQHVAAPRSFTAEFERDSEGRLQLKGRLKQDAAGPWWFRTVIGTTPEGRKTLVIWRKLTGDAEQDNLVLETWFRDKQAFSVKDTEFDLIYVNGDNTLENLRLPDETWKVRLTEEDFQRLMFEGTEA